MASFNIKDRTKMRVEKLQNELIIRILFFTGRKPSLMIRLLIADFIANRDLQIDRINLKSRVVKFGKCLVDELKTKAVALNFMFENHKADIIDLIIVKKNSFLEYLFHILSSESF